jgi:hypothetical protein
MTIPRSYYLVRKGYNSFVLRINGVAYNITVPPGNYTALNFITLLIPLMNAVSSNSFTMVFNTIIGKYTYSYVGTASSVEFVFVDPDRIAHQMGFDETSDNLFVANTLQSANVVDFVSTSTLFLHSDIVQDQSSVLQEVYSDNSIPFSNLVYNCKFPAMYSKALRTSTSDTFNFSLTDEHDQEVDLNGHDICITLLLYKKENLTRLLKEVLLKDG